MPRKILGTESLNNGNGILEPTGTDRGEGFTKTIVEFMRILATHTHNGDNSLYATLPNGSAGYSSTTPAESTDALGRKFYAYTVIVPNTAIDTIRSISLFSKATTDADILENWKALHCDYHLTEQVAAPNNLVVNITGLTKDNLDIKAVI